jgi:hypothetical protein
MPPAPVRTGDYGFCPRQIAVNSETFVAHVRASWPVRCRESIRGACSCAMPPGRRGRTPTRACARSGALDLSGNGDNITQRRPTLLARRCPAAAVACAAALFGAAAAVATDYEGPRTFRAAEILSPSQLKGLHYEVAPEVTTEGYLHVFQLDTDFGPLEAEGRSLLIVREHETDALAELDEVSRAGVFVKAAGNSLLKTGKGIVAVVKDPEGTAKGFGSGIKRFGVNLGRSAKRAGEKAVDSVSGDHPSDAGDKSTGRKAAEAGEGIANSAFGVNSAARRWAKKVAVDPYTTNPLLKKALVELGRVDAAGGLAAKIVLPIPTLFTTTATVGDLVWSEDPQALMKRNEKMLADLGVSGDGIKQLYLSRGFTLTLQTRLASALSAVKAKGSAAYVETAAEAATPRDGLFFVESVEMMQRLHREKARVAAVLPDSRALVVSTRDRRAVALLPVDWIGWTEPLDEAAASIEKRAPTELRTRRLELWTTAAVSPLAKAELERRGWTVVERLPWAIEAMKRSVGTRAAPRRP